MIETTRQKPGVRSETTGRNLGRPRSTKAEAAIRLRQVEFVKHARKAGKQRT